jgi:antitoxin component YwqK of YwqJK toxin-antitoxin module
MKKVIILLALVSTAVFATVCEDEYIFISPNGEDLLDFNGGVYYNPTNNKPYSGKLTYSKHDDYRNCSGYELFHGNMKNGKLHGESKSFYKSGKLQSVRYYKDGKAQGEWKSFYESEKLLSVANYNDGKQQGEWKSFYENGKLQSIKNYKYGKAQENCGGNILFMAHDYNYKYGTVQAEWKEFYENGNLKLVGNYKLSKDDCSQCPQGDIKEFDINGKLIGAENYDIYCPQDEQ